MMRWSSTTTSRGTEASPFDLAGDRLTFVQSVEVERLGVTFVLVPDGMTTRLFEDGLKEWARRKQKKSSI